MSKWDNFVQNVGEIADKTVSKTRELTDAASLKIKIANKEAERDSQYKALGKLAYIKLRKLRGHDSEETTQKISKVMDKLDKTRQEIADLKAIDKARKEAKEAEKQAREKAKKAADHELEEKLNLSVMNEFNEARKAADAEYEKALKAAEDAKGE